MRLAYLVIAASLSTGCTLFFTGGDDDELCALEDPRADVAHSQPAAKRDPGNLTCESFEMPCNSECGPCTQVGDLALVPPVPPIPSWNYCGHRCEQLGESACAADAACRVVKDASCVFGGACETDFLGCFPVDTIPDVSIVCQAADSWSCSRSSACAAIHSQPSCPINDTDCPRPFELCVPEGTDPGECTGAITCRQLPPACPVGATPGIASGCYTGACIPRDLCSTI